MGLRDIRVFRNPSNISLDAIPDKAGIAIGGLDADSDPGDTVYRFDNGWETIDPLPEARHRLAAT